MARRRFLAFDLGAESGRAMVGAFDGGRLELTQLHRFPNGATEIAGGLHWDPPRLFAEMEVGLAAFAGRFGPTLDGIGVDTWGLDFGLLDRHGELLENPFSYRDRRTDGMLELALTRVAQQEIYDRTGIQFLRINTLYQLLSLSVQRPEFLARADALLMMADLFNYLLTGIVRCEYTNATTTQFYDPRQRRWARELLEQLELPVQVLTDVVDPGTTLGPILPAVARKAGLQAVPVIAPGTHDTASAVASVPATKDGFVFISSGTWSLLGVELERPVLTRSAMAHNFTNEGGVAGTIRFLKNIMGLWLVQECRRTWQLRGHAFSYEELTAMARVAKPFRGLVDPDDDRFLPPGDMEERLRQFCLQSGQEPPDDCGGWVRLILESLALQYRRVLSWLEETLERRFDRVHIVGGGANNEVLCQFTANATGLPVIAGPTEATVIGNLLVQAMARGELNSLAELRQVVRDSFPTQRFEPSETGIWDDAYERFCRLARK